MINKYIKLLFVFAILALAGWINNIIWLIDKGFSDFTGQVLFSVIGVVLAPVGAFHGFYLWFT